MTDHYAVIGNPIEHSKSPAIHATFAQQTGEEIDYTRILGEMDGFKRNVADFISRGGKGLNITVPFKEDAWRLADERSPGAETAGAVNTLILLEDGRLRGDNTDGTGLVRELGKNHGCELKGKRILLLGAGGASRGVIRPLLDTEPLSLTIANRTASKAISLAQDTHHLGPVSGCGLDQLTGQKFDLIINGTAAGLGGKVPEIPDDILESGGWCYDMMYSDKPTAFVTWGRQHHAEKSMDGLGMLIEQAAESFYLWRGVRPDTQAVIHSMRPNPEQPS